MAWIQGLFDQIIAFFANLMSSGFQSFLDFWSFLLGI